MEKDFLSRLTEIIQEHISDEMFGVSELAAEIGMSRSNLLRKIKKLSNVSASQFIRQVRLKQAMEMLKKSSLTVSEIAYKVGFSSTSYFIKCFREEYGYPPGEAGKRDGISDQAEGQKQGHQLVAIMFTDIEGYTALMQKDEEKAIQFRNRHREVFNAVTEKFNGKILQYYGDGTLSTFNSAIDAVRCGIEMQRAFGEASEIPVRIGIHTGDILFSKDGIIGDGVNVASRIESLAVAHSVFISEKVYDEIKNQAGIETISMGVFELKNVDKPIEVFAISNEGLIVPKPDQLSGKVKVKPVKAADEKQVVGKRLSAAWVLLPVTVVLLGFILFTSKFFTNSSDKSSPDEAPGGRKSIAVLPFINDSSDSSNVYIINGLMEATLNNLQKIQGLRVISRTSAEKYRNSDKTSPEIAKELNVQYLIEGSGQKIGDQIMLHIQLIEAGSDQNLWGERYSRETKNIFALQSEIADDIIEQIQVIITPEERQRIGKAPTDDLVAYDFFLQGYNLLKSTRESSELEKAIGYFEKAIEQDPKFARAYAAVAISYYYLDDFRAEKLYGEKINYYADQALLLDDKLPQSMIAKALFYMHNKEYELAVSYFEKTLEYNPNDDLVYIFLVDLYKNHLPNTEKYLEYALKGIDLDISTYDSLTASLNYLQISNAFVQSGFVKEAERYINRSLDYYPENPYSRYLKAYILFAKDKDLEQLNQRLISVYRKDSSNMEVIQEIGKIYYYMRDYDSAYWYYRKFYEIRKVLKLDIYRGENAKIALVFSKKGFGQEADQLLDNYLDYANNDQTIYRYLSLAAYYSVKDEKARAMENLKLFAQQENYFYWILLFTDIDPLLDNIKDLPEFGDIMKDIETKFWNYHKSIRTTLEREGLI